MLIVMSFNVYLICSVLVGSMSGYFIFNPLLLKKRSISKLPISRQHMREPCHAEECGSLINGQDDQVATGTPLTTYSGDNSPHREPIVSGVLLQTPHP